MSGSSAIRTMECVRQAFSGWRVTRPEMPARLPNQSMRGGLLGEDDVTTRIAAVGGRVKDLPEGQAL